MRRSTYIAPHKFLCIIYSLLTAFLIIVTRITYLQIYHGDSYKHKSTSNFVRHEEIRSLRGNITDTHGNLLVTNRPIYRLCWRGTAKRKLTQTQKELLSDVAQITGHRLPTIKTVARAERYNKITTLIEDVPFDMVCRLEERFGLTHNIMIITSFQRHYPYETLASHLIGYLGSAQNKHVGKMGLEYLYDDFLQGTPGQLEKTINSFGAKLTERPLKSALHGQTIRTTIDLKIQQLAEAVFPESCTGSCILFDPNTGALRAVVSRPNFDPSRFLSPISNDEWNTFIEKQPFLNRAFRAVYPPGSIFKLVTISAALEHNIITPNTIWNCTGFVTFGNRDYRCHKRTGHGHVTARQAMAQSCNPFFYDIGTKIPIDILADYAHRFGLGEKTGLIFSENPGLIPSTRWKESCKGERWWPGETLSAVIGQSYLLVTPIQVARMISAIFTGKLVKPRLIENEPYEESPLHIAQETREFLQSCMKFVVTAGTGKGLNRLSDFEIYAKTSTAQTSSTSLRSCGTSFMEHGWFVTYFQYKDHPPLTMVIITEHTGSSVRARTIAKSFLRNYKQLLDA